MAQLTSGERKLLVYMLDKAGDEFSAHGCNDLDLVKEVQLTPEESLEVRKILTEEGDYPDDEVKPNAHSIQDWLAFVHFSKKFRDAP